MPETAYSVSVAGDFSPLYKQASEAAKQVQLIFSKAFLQGSSFSRPLGEISGKADEFAKSMAAANARVIAFGASAGLIYNVVKAMKEMVASTIEVDKALTNINTLLRLNGEGLAKFGTDLFNIAKLTGQGFADIAKGATELARQGLGAQETLTRIRDAAILSRQSGLDMADSVDTLTASINSFSRTALTTTQVINKLANVDQSFAVSSKDLAEGIKRVGSTAQDAGVSIDELIALITSAQQTTSRGGAVIGNALKTILTRIERPEVINQLQEAGVAVRDLEGNVRPTIEILKAFAKQFQDVGQAQQSHLAELVGSVYQINILKALVDDISKSYGTYNSAVRTSSTALNEAIERNEEYNKSLDATLNRIRLGVKEVGVAIGNQTIAPALNKIIDDFKLLGSVVPDELTDLGEKFGSGILTGLADFISGPGIVLLGATFGKLAKDLGTFFVKASKDFFSLTTNTKRQEELVLKMQEVLAREPQLIDAVLNKKITQIKFEETILALVKERLAVESQLTTVTNTAASNLIKRGDVTVGRSGLSAKGGRIPSFALIDENMTNIPGLAEAIRRESHSVSRSQIRVGQDTRLKSPTNPLGLGVYNTRDEPLGLHQGINRAYQEGKNPRDYGEKGKIPSFADPFTFSELVPSSFQVDLKEAIDKLKDAVRSGALKTEEFSNAIDKLTKVFPLTTESVKRVQNILNATSQTRRGNLKTAFEAGLERAAAVPLPKLGFKPLVTPILDAFEEELKRIAAKVPAFGVSNVAKFEEAGGQFNFFAPNAFARPTPLPRALGLRNANEPGLGQNQQGFNFDNFFRGPISGTSEQQRLERALLQGSIRQKQDQEAQAARVLNPDPQAREKFAQIRQLTEERLQAQVEEEIRLQEHQKNVQAALAQKIQDSRARHAKKIEELTERAVTSLSSYIPGTKNFDRAQALKQSNPTFLANARERNISRFQNAALVTSFAAPIVAGVVSEFIGDKSQTTRGLGASVQGLANVASFSSLGLSFGGPKGALIGGGIGLATSLPSVIAGFTDKLPDLQRGLDELRKASVATNDALTVYVQTSERLQGVYSGLISATKGTVATLESQRSEAFSKLSPAQQSRLSGALGARGIAGLNDERRLIEQEGKQTELRQNLRLELEKFKQRLGIINNQLTEDDPTRQIGTKPFTSLKAGVSVQVPVFAQKLTPEAAGQAESIRQTILGIRGPLDKTLVEVLRNDPEGNAKAFDEISAALKNNDITPFTDFLQTNLSKTGLGTDDTAVIVKAIQSIPEQAQSLFVEKLLPSFSPSGVKGLSEFNEAFKVVSQKLQKDLDNFSNRIASATIIMGEFNKSVEGNVRILSQDFAAREERRQTVANGFIESKQDLVGPATLNALRNQAAILSIRGERNAGAFNAGLGFQQDTSRAISSSSIAFLNKVLSQSTDEKFLGNAKESRQNAFAFLDNLGIGIGGLDKLTKPGDIEGSRGSIERILANIEKERARILEKDTFLSTDTNQKNLLDDLEGPLREALVDLASSVEQVNQKERQALALQEILNQQAINQINLQKKLSVGGGIGQLLSSGNPFGTALGLGQSAFRTGRGAGNSLLQAQGALEIGDLLSSLGVSELPTEIRNAIKSGLTDQLRSTFESAGVSLTQGSFEDIAEQQIQNRFRTEDTQAQLLAQMKNLVENNGSIEQNIATLVNLASGSGLFVKFKEQLTKDKFDNADGPFNIPQGTYSSLDNAPLTPAMDLKEYYGTISKRNAFNLGSRKRRSGRLQSLASDVEFGDKSLSPIPPGDADVNFNITSPAAAALQRKAFGAAFDIPQGSAADLAKGPLTPIGTQLLGNLGAAFFSGSGQQGFGAQAGGQLRGLPVTRSEAVGKSLSSARGLDPQNIFALVQAAVEGQELGFTQAGANRAIIETAERIANITSDTNAFKRAGIALDEKRLELEIKVAAGAIDSLQAQKELTVEIERQVSLIALKEFKQGKISGEELRQQKSGLFGAKIEAGDFGIGDAFDAFRDEFRYNSKDWNQDLLDGAKEIGSTMKSSFKEGFQAFIEGSKSAEDALRDFGLDVLGKITEKITDSSVDILFSGIGNVIGGIGNVDYSKFFRNKGGLIQAYGRGGKVKGGSGMRDDVPAMLTNGEYVVRKASVQKYGEDFLQQLNSGRVQGVFKNSFAYNNAKRPTRGFFNVSSDLSSLALTDENNPQNRLKFERETTFYQYIRDKKAYEEQKKYAIRQFERAQEQRLMGAYISAAVQIAGGAYNQYNAGQNGIPKNSYDFNQNYNANFGRYANRGGMIGPYGVKRYAGGGAAFGGDSGTDNIPAMLTGGEFVIRRPVVDRLGVDFFHKLNRGTLPLSSVRRYQTGGLVGDVASGGNYGVDRLGDVIAKLAEIASLFKEQKPTNARSAAPQGQVGGEIVNNINITVNVDKSGKVESRTENNGKIRDEDPAKNERELGDLIKQSVLKVILEQKRPGGMLEKT